jgi:hypothetical protein
MKQSSQPEQVSKLKFFAIAGSVPALLVGIGVGFYFMELAPMQRQFQVRDRMSLTILSLAERRPPELTEDQWAYCILWTWNLHSNYSSFASYISTDDLERIEKGLRERTKSEVSLETIDWFWDEYTGANSKVANYDHFRPTAPENRADFEAGAHGGNPLSGWQQDYKAAKLEAGR